MSNAPIGIFDSGIGGLSVLRHIRADLPHEDLLYFADAGHLPYGDKSEAEIVQRALTIAQFLCTRNAKALVVACNTATAAAIQALRAHYPTLALVGIEPGLKPAALQTRSQHVGVLATHATIASARFGALRDQLSATGTVQFHSAICSGLADQIEQGALHTPATAALLEGHLSALVALDIDVLVLGCTHYAFVRPLIETLLRRLSQKPITIIDTAQPVSQQLSRLLEHSGLRRTAGQSGQLSAFTTASADALQSAFAQLLQLTPPVVSVAPQYLAS